MAGKKVFTLPDEEVFVKFIKRQRGSIINQNHILYGGMLENSYKEYPVKQLKNGKFANVLTDEEKEGLENIMGLEPNALSIYNKKDNYWNNIKVKLTKEGVHFNLKDPEDYIKVKILESYDDQIAPSVKELNRQQKATYLFVIVRGDEESVVYNAKIDIKKEAFKALGKIEDSKEAMEDFLMMFGTPVSKDSSLDWIRSQVNTKADENPKKFLEILADPDYKMKVLLKKAVKQGILTYSGGQYVTVGDNLNVSHKNEVPNLGNALVFLQSPEGQDMRLRIESELK